MAVVASIPFTPSVNCIEAYALYVGLHITCERGLTNILIEGDCQVTLADSWHQRDLNSLHGLQALHSRLSVFSFWSVHVYPVGN